MCEEQLDAGKDVILEIEIQGALKVKEEFPGYSAFVCDTSAAGELKNRLVGRGTETMDVIESRMNRACEEAEGMEQYDYLIVNDDLNTCVEEMHRIIQGEHRRSCRNEAFMKTIKEDLERFERRRLNMLHPSYTDLMKVVNKDVEEGETKIVNSRYSIVMATSKSARQLIAGDLPLVDAKEGEKPLSIAIEELNEGKLKIIAESARRRVKTMRQNQTVSAFFMLADESCHIKDTSEKYNKKEEEV